MKVNSGIPDSSRGPGRSSIGPSVPAARTQPRAPASARSAPGARPRAARPESRRHGAPGPSVRRSALALALAGAGLAMIGCASPSDAPWRVEGAYRLHHSGAAPAQGYLALARRYEGEARHAQALDAYRKAAQAAPDDADVLNALGQALAQQGQLAAALATLRRALALEPERAQLLNNLGYALTLAGQTEQARTLLREALRRDPHHRLARANLARLDPPQAVADAPASGPSAETLQPRAQATASRAESRPAAAAEVLVLAAVTAASPPAAAPEHKPAPPAAAAPPQLGPPVQAAQLRIEVSNGNGVNGMAAWVRGWLRAHRLARDVRLSNMARFDNPTTVVEYQAGFAAAARAIARNLPQPASVASAPSRLPYGDVRLLLGHDLRAAIACGRTCGPYAEVPIAAARAGAAPVR